MKFKKKLRLIINKQNFLTKWLNQQTNIKNKMILILYIQKKKKFEKNPRLMWWVVFKYKNQLNMTYYLMIQSMILIEIRNKIYR